MSDPPSNPRGSKPYLPPPPESFDDSPSVHFPRMDPPPASLEAMVRRSKPGSPLPREPERDASWRWVVVVVVVLVLGAVLYFAELHH